MQECRLRQRGDAYNVCVFGPIFFDNCLSTIFENGYILSNSLDLCGKILLNLSSIRQVSTKAIFHMRYSQWNELLFEYYFGDEKDHEVFLGIDKESLIDYVLERGVFDEEIENAISLNPCKKIDYSSYVWNSFTQLFRSRETISKTVLLNVFRKHLKDSDVPDVMPTVFPCLALFIMPLANNPDMDPRNFYDRVTDFFRENYIIGPYETINTPDLNQFVAPTLKTMWENLEIWAQSEGYQYRVKSSPNTRWKYVAPFMAESLLTASQRDSFKVVFYEAGLTPDQDMSDERIVSILDLYHKEIGFTDEMAWKKVFENYQDILIDVFHRQYNKWDGNTIVKIHENERSISRDYGNNKKLYLCMNILRGNYNFFFKSIFSDAEPGSEFEYKGSGQLDFSFSISSDGYSEESLFISNLAEIVSGGEGITLRDASNTRNKLSFRNEDFFLFEKYYNTYSSSCKLKIGGKFYFLVKKDAITEYQDWLKENAAREITDRHAFSSLYSLYHIESVKTSLPSHNALNCATRKTIKVVDTFVIKREASSIVLYQGLPVYFQIEGINVEEDKVRILFDQGFRLTDRDLEYDENRRLWKLPIITNQMLLEESFQVYCNDQLLSPARYSFGDFDALADDSYDEIGYDAWGNYTQDDAEFKGLNLKCTTGLAYLLEDNMKRFGKDTKFEKRAYQPTDYLLYWLSSRPRADKEDFTEAIRVQVQNAIASDLAMEKWGVRALIDNYCRLGYINYAYHEGKHILAVNKPTFVLLPSSVNNGSIGGSVSSVSCAEKQFKLLLTGARTPEFIDKLLRRAEGFNYNGARIFVQVDEASGPLYPQRIIFWSSSIFAIKEFAAKYGIQYQHTIYSNSLLEKLGSVEDYETHIVNTQQSFRETYEGFTDLTAIDYKQLSELLEEGAYIKMDRVSHSSFDKNGSVVTYFPGKYKEKTILWKDGRQYPVDKYWGHFIGMKYADAKVAKIDKDSMTLYLPWFIKLPMLYARAMTMITGEIPETSRGKRIYQLCDNPFAGASSPSSILKKLNQ